MDIFQIVPELSSKDLHRLVRKLVIDEDNFERANSEQPKLYLMASRHKIDMMKIKNRRQAKLEVLRADISLALRKQKHRQSRGERMTETEIQNRVMADPVVRKARAKFERALEAEEFAKQLVEAYKQRQMVLKIISDTRNAEIASEIRNVKEGMARDIMLERSQEARKLLRQRGI